MRKILFVTLLLFSSSLTFAQNATNYWVLFTDKNNSPYSLTEPSAFLSERAIIRRIVQKIEMTTRDLPVNPAYLTGIASKGATVKNTSKWMNAATITLSDPSKLSAIAALPYVKSVTRIDIQPSVKSLSKFGSNGESYLRNSADAMENYDYGPSGNQSAMIGVTCMHMMGFTGEGMVIAVLDAGFYNANILPAFDSIRLNGQILGCRDIVTGDTMVYEDFPHGMNVLSTMAGNLPGKIVGTAPKASYWLLRTEDAASESIQEEINWLVGAEFADSVGADIINCSLGYTTFDNASTNHTYADMDGNTTIVTKAADWAASTGMFVVVSAGNLGSQTWQKISAPADADSVLTVGAVDPFGTIAGFSSRGPTSDGRIKPNIVAQGSSSITAANAGDITTNNGTSFSGPIAAGAVACLWQANPARTNMEIMNAIHRSSSQFGAPDTVKGYGIPNFCWADYILAGINENSSREEEINVYPNPFVSGIRIDFFSDKKQKIDIELYDISGRIIISHTDALAANMMNSLEINVDQDLSKGMYLVRIKAGEKVYNKKLVKE